MACSNYHITIKDTQAGSGDNEVVGAGELVAASSIKLSHRGGDRLDVPIIGSSLSWTFVGLDCSDGRYQQLFTGDENRFEVKLFDEGDNIIWTGFLLPDSYLEPYRNFVQDVSFQAVDGLGRLKGKFLEDFPSEISVIDAITRILRLTGLEINLRFAPAIVNRLQQDYKHIFIPTSGWEGRDAYSILEGLLESMASTLFQSNGFWNLEGWNIRAQPFYATEEYSAWGLLIGTDVLNRDVKDVEVLAGGNVTMQPPYGVIELSHERKDLVLSEGLHSPSEKEWDSYTSSSDAQEVYVDEWSMSEDFPVLYDGDDVYFSRGEGAISVKRRPYIKEGRRYELDLSFEIELEDEESGVDEQLYRNPFYYEVWVGDEVLYSNREDAGIRIDLNFTNEEPTTELNFEFRARASGLLDIVLFPIKEDSGNPTVDFSDIERVFIRDVTVKDLDFVDPLLVRRISNENFTTTKQATLEYADDDTGESLGFRLDRLDVPSGYTPFLSNSYRDLLFQGEWVNFVDLKTAYLIHNNLEGVISNPAIGPIEVSRVEFNWLGGQEHAFITPYRLYRSPGADPIFSIQVFDYNPVTGVREHWESWGDNVYRIEQRQYLDAYADVVHRVFGEPLARADLPLWENIKINDMLRADYDGEKLWALSSCEWDIDRGRTEVVAVQSLAVPLPPAVEIGEERYVVEDSVILTAEAYSPNSTIESFEWEIIEGEGSLDTTSGDSVTVSLVDPTVRVRVTVTDANGLTGSDETTVFRQANVNLVWETVRTTPTFRYKLVSSEPIPEGYVILLRGSIELRNVEPVYDSIYLSIDDHHIVEPLVNPHLDSSGLHLTFGGYLNGSLEFSLTFMRDTEIIADFDLDTPDQSMPGKGVFVEIPKTYYVEGFGEVGRPQDIFVTYPGGQPG